jgi:hypothetical protein
MLIMMNNDYADADADDDNINDDVSTIYIYMIVNNLRATKFC